MLRFVVGHATHPQWQGALALAAVQIDAQIDAQIGPGRLVPTLGLVYFTDSYAREAEPLLAALSARWPGVAWSGCVGIGVAASGVEYFDEPALAITLTNLPRERFRVFSGAQPLMASVAGSAMDPVPATALVHADPAAPELPDLLTDLAARTTSGYLFGGVAASRTRTCQIADGVFEGGLSGVAFGPEVAIVSRVTQGSQPVGPVRRITACERNVATELDGRPALECLLADLSLTLDEPRHAMAALRATLVGLATPAGPLALRGEPVGPARHRAFGADVRVRHLIGLDPARQGVAVAELLDTGMTLAFCQRDTAAARRDLTRICTEIRDELAPETLPVRAAVALPDADTAPFDPASRIAGAIYVSCSGRGGPHFGAPSAELQIVRHALGDVPLVGFFAAGEIGHANLYGYTGVLSVFVRD